MQKPHLQVRKKKNFHPLSKIWRIPLKSPNYQYQNIMYGHSWSNNSQQYCGNRNSLYASPSKENASSKPVIQFSVLVKTNLIYSSVCRLWLCLFSNRYMSMYMIKESWTLIWFYKFFLSAIIIQYTSKHLYTSKHFPFIFYFQTEGFQILSYHFYTQLICSISLYMHHQYDHALPKESTQEVMNFLCSIWLFFVFVHPKYQVSLSYVKKWRKGLFFSLLF